MGRPTRDDDRWAVSRATAVTVMLWKQQKDISAAQLAGDYSGLTLRTSRPPLAWSAPRIFAANDNQSAKGKTKSTVREPFEGA
jgi:hypothetical protein